MLEASKDGFLMPNRSGLVGPVLKSSLDQIAAALLRNAIMEGAVGLGDRVTEVALATELNLSRGTIRAALQRLAAEGLVVQRPYSGWHIVTFSAHDTLELFTLRGCLEGFAARLAAEHIDTAGKEVLSTSFEALRKAVLEEDGNSIAASDFEFHNTIVQLARHARLSIHYGLVAQQVKLCIRHSNSVCEDKGSILMNHKPLMHAIMKGEKDEAGRLAEMHCDLAIRDLMQESEKG